MDQDLKVLTIELRELEVLCHVGVGEEERERLQPLSFNIKVELKSLPSSDELAMSYDYTVVTDTIAGVARRTKYKLLETLSIAVASELLENPLIVSAEVTVKKLRPPVEAHLAYAAVTYFQKK